MLGSPTPHTSVRLFRLNGGISGTPEPIAAGSFAELGALEVKHLEKWLKLRPDILGEELEVIASQVTGFDKTQDRPDLLAFDRRGKLVVIEIKRDTSGSAQDLQAIRYAAYVSTLTAETVVDLYRRYRNAQFDESLSDTEARERLEEFATLETLEAVDSDPVPRIILVARDFRPAVTSTALWLRRNFEDFDISCVQLTPYDVHGTVVLAAAVLIPLPEAAAFEVRIDAKRRRARRPGGTIDFEAAKAFIESIPPGRWASYGDVAAAAGAPKGGQAIGTWLLTTGTEIANVWRVLKRNGEVSEGWKGEHPDVPTTPDDVRKTLQTEGVVFDSNRASQGQRWTAEDLTEAETEGTEGTHDLATALSPPHASS